MHVVDTTLFYSPTSGGVRRYLNAKHEWYIGVAGHQHSLLVPGERTALVPDGVSTIAGSIVPGTFNYRLPLSAHHWSQMLEALEPDLIEVGDAFHPAWCTLRVAQRRCIPAVAFCHSHLPRLIGTRCGNAAGRFAARYLGSLYARFDLVLVPSQFMCDHLRSLGVPRVRRQPLGVDTTAFHPDRRHTGLRAQLGLPEQVRLLVYAGRFSAEKNMQALHDAFTLLGPRYHLLVIGGGAQRRPAGNITVLPYRRDHVALASMLASADALVHAGTSETFGLVILETMACGRPVVGVRAAAVGELICDEIGVTAAQARGEQIAAAVRELYERDLEAMGRAARARVESHYAWDLVLREQLALYESLSEEPRMLPRCETAAGLMPVHANSTRPASSRAPGTGQSHIR